MLKQSAPSAWVISILAMAAITCLGFLNVMNSMGVYDFADCGNYIAAGISQVLSQKPLPLGVQYSEFLNGNYECAYGTYPAPFLQIFLAFASGMGWSDSITFSSAALFVLIPVFIFNFSFYYVSRFICGINHLLIAFMLLFFNFTPLSYSIYRPIGEPFLLAFVFVAILFLLKKNYGAGGILLATAYFFRVQALPFVPSFVLLFIKDKKAVFKYGVGFVAGFLIVKLLLTVFWGVPFAGSEKFYASAYNDLNIDVFKGAAYFVHSRPLLFALFLVNTVIFFICKNDLVRKVNLLCVNCFGVMFVFLYCYALFKIGHVPGRYVVYYFPITLLGSAVFLQYLIDKYSTQIERFSWLKKALWVSAICVLLFKLASFDLAAIDNNMKMIDSDPDFVALPITPDDKLIVTDKAIRARAFFTFKNTNLINFQSFKYIKNEKGRPRKIIEGPERFINNDNSLIDYVFVGGVSASWMKLVDGKDEIVDNYGNKFKLVASKDAHRRAPDTIANRILHFSNGYFPQHEKQIYSVMRKFDLLPRGYDMPLYRVFKRVDA